jgi:hypothetical protein
VFGILGLGFKKYVFLPAYFMELATPHTEEAIKLVDKVGDFEIISIFDTLSHRNALL